MSCNIVHVKVTSEAHEVTIDEALKILESAKLHNPNAVVDVTIYHIMRRLEFKGEG